MQNFVESPYLFAECTAIFHILASNLVGMYAEMIQPDYNPKEFHTKHGKQLYFDLKAHFEADWNAIG